MSFRNSVGARLMFAFAGVFIVIGAAVSLSIGRLAACGAAELLLAFSLAATAVAWLFAFLAYARPQPSR